MSGSVGRRDASQKSDSVPEPNANAPSGLKNQARGRAVREQASIDIRDPPFGGANPASTAQHSSFCLDGAGLRRDRPHE